MEQTKGQIRALDILKRSEAGEPRADIAASYGVGESSIYFETRFGRFLRYRGQHPDDRANIGAWGAFDKLWARTDKKAPDLARFTELICALPLAADAPHAKPLRKAKTTAPEASWPLATEAEAIIADKATTEPEPTPAPVAEPKVTYVENYRAPEPDAAAAKRAKKTLAQRLRRADSRRSPDQVWEAPTQAEEDHIKMALQEYLAHGDFEPSDDGRYEWGASFIRLLVP